MTISASHLKPFFDPFPICCKVATSGYALFKMNTWICICLKMEVYSENGKLNRTYNHKPMDFAGDLEQTL